MNFVGQVKSLFGRNRPTDNVDQLRSNEEKPCVKQEFADEIEIIDRLSQIQVHLRANRIRYEDIAFPADDRSLLIEENLTIEQLMNYDRIIWLRPHQIIPTKWIDNDRTSWALFRDPKPNDVIQGALGDCWFITALSVLAEQADFLYKVFLTKEFNEEGIYCIRLCQDGIWQSVTIDDRLPCTTKRRLAYSQADRKQLWVPLIEKALAKLYGNYQQIIAGRCSEGLSIVSGAACETLVISDYVGETRTHLNENDLWKQLVESRRNKFMMCAMCHNNRLMREEFDRYGLMNDHAYSLQDIEQSIKERRVKLRNPWGKKIRHESKERDNGVFWISFELFLKYFECVDICKIRRDWFEIRSKGFFFDDRMMMDGFRLIVDKETEVDISLFRKLFRNSRFMDSSEIRIGFALIQLDGDHTNSSYRISSIVMLSRLTNEKSLSSSAKIERGTYFLLLILFNPTKKYLDQRQFHLAIHSSSSIDCQPIKYSPDIEKEFLIKLTLSHGEQVFPNDKHRSIRIFELRKHWDGLVFLVENRHKKKNIHFHFRCSLSQNAHFSRCQYRLFDVIPAKHRQIIVVVSRKNPKHSFTFAHDFQYSFSTDQYHVDLKNDRLMHWPTIDRDDLHLPEPIS